MPDSTHLSDSIDRRRFLVQVSAAAAAAGVAGGALRAADQNAKRDEKSPAGATPSKAASPTDAAQGDMPTIQLGRHRVTRLVCGSNPMNGYSYMGHHADQHMREFFTLDRMVEFLLNCEKQGINTHQFSNAGFDKSLQAIRIVRERGSKMQFIFLGSDLKTVKQVAEQATPIAMVHHGGRTDSFFHDGKKDAVRDYVKAVHDTGLLAGVSAHNPDNIRRIADEGWDVDFFMTCFYFLTREKVQPAPGGRATPSLELGGSFFHDDPKAMTQVIRQVKQPCLAFKILGAGRLCHDAQSVRQAFAYAFANIKPTDGVIVGMYPRFLDEISANAQYARELGKIA